MLNPMKLAAATALSALAFAANANHFELVPTEAFDAETVSKDLALTRQGQVVQIELWANITLSSGVLGGGYSISHSPELAFLGWLEDPLGDGKWRYSPRVASPTEVLNGYFADFSVQPDRFRLGTLAFLATSKGEFTVEAFLDTQDSLWIAATSLQPVVFMQADTTTVKVNE